MTMLSYNTSVLEETKYMRYGLVFSKSVNIFMSEPSLEGESNTTYLILSYLID